MTGDTRLVVSVCQCSSKPRGLHTGVLERRKPEDASRSVVCSRARCSVRSNDEVNNMTRQTVMRYATSL